MKKIKLIIGSQEVGKTTLARELATKSMQYKGDDSIARVDVIRIFGKNGLNPFAFAGLNSNHSVVIFDDFKINNLGCLFVLLKNGKVEFCVEKPAKETFLIHPDLIVVCTVDNPREYFAQMPESFRRIFDVFICELDKDSYAVVSLNPEWSL